MLYRILIKFYPKNESYVFFFFKFIIVLATWWAIVADQDDNLQSVFIRNYLFYYENILRHPSTRTALRWDESPSCATFFCNGVSYSSRLQQVMRCIAIIVRDAKYYGHGFNNSSFVAKKWYLNSRQRMICVYHIAWVGLPEFFFWKYFINFREC